MTERDEKAFEEAGIPYHENEHGPQRCRTCFLAGRASMRDVLKGCAEQMELYRGAMLEASVGGGSDYDYWLARARAEAEGK